jgi:hypothetical protein
MREYRNSELHSGNTYYYLAENLPLLHLPSEDINLKTQTTNFPLVLYGENTDLPQYEKVMLRAFEREC